MLYFSSSLDWLVLNDFVKYNIQIAEVLTVPMHSVDIYSELRLIYMATTVIWQAGVGCNGNLDECEMLHYSKVWLAVTMTLMVSKVSVPGRVMPGNSDHLRKVSYRLLTQYNPL